MRDEPAGKGGSQPIEIRTHVRCLIVATVFLWVLIRAAAPGRSPDSPIHFDNRNIDFSLDSCETPQRHAPETMAGGVALFDYNNDGFPDIFFTNGADIRTLKKSSPKYSNRLFENDGHGAFRDVTQKSGLAGIGFDNGVAVGDYDNDGFKDIFVGGVHASRLYHNTGNGTFTDVTGRAGLEVTDERYGPLWSVGGAFLDVNNDGLLDLFVTNYLAWDIKTEPPCEASPGRLDYCHPKFYKPTPNQLFLNTGNGAFRDISEESGIRAHPAKGMGTGVADYDLDGRLDVFVPNDKLYNSLFHNKGGGKFEEIAFKTGVAMAEYGQFISGMGVDFRDIDNDGYPDIVFVALENETFPVFRNARNGTFTDDTERSSMMRLSVSMAGYSPTIADIDNDGWKDIFVTRGHVQSLGLSSRTMVEQPNTVFANLGQAGFRALTAEAGLTAQPPRRHRGSAVGDLNLDGRLDAVVTAISSPAELWMNDSPGGNHWLEFDLEGTRSNRDGIGARIKVAAAGKAQYNHVNFAVGYASSSTGPVHFGLGRSESADLVEIRWPSGIVQELRNVAADRVVKVKEPAK